MKSKPCSYLYVRKWLRAPVKCLVSKEWHHVFAVNLNWSKSQSCLSRCRWVNPACTCAATSNCDISPDVGQFLNASFYFLGLKQWKVMSILNDCSFRWMQKNLTSLVFALCFVFFFLCFNLDFVWHWSVLHCSQECTRIQGCLYPVFIH